MGIMRSELKCPICDKIPNAKRLEVVLADGVSYNITTFDPKDPVIVSEKKSTAPLKPLEKKTWPMSGIDEITRLSGEN